jgi:hypothetical protein
MILNLYEETRHYKGLFWYISGIPKEERPQVAMSNCESRQGKGYEWGS